MTRTAAELEAALSAALDEMNTHPRPVFRIGVPVAEMERKAAVRREIAEKALDEIGCANWREQGEPANVMLEYLAGWIKDARAEGVADHAAARIQTGDYSIYA